MDNNGVKKIEISSRLFVVLVILILAILAGITAGIIYKFWPPIPYREISVSAEGKALAVPDVAILDLGVKSEAFEVKTVIQDNTEKINAILTEIKNLGVAEKDIQTIRYNLAPQYDWTEEKGKIFKGYVLEQEVRVKVRDFNKIGQVIEKATNRGANLIGDLSFSIDNPEDLRAKAREEAIKKAKEKAELIAQQTGLKLKRIINIYENQYYYPIRSESLMKETLTPNVALAPEIQPGELEVSVQITLVYRIK